MGLIFWAGCAGSLTGKKTVCATSVLPPCYLRATCGTSRWMRMAARRMRTPRIGPQSKKKKRGRPPKEGGAMSAEEKAKRKREKRADEKGKKRALADEEAAIAHEGRGILPSVARRVSAG